MKRQVPIAFFVLLALFVISRFEGCGDARREPDVQRGQSSPRASRVELPQREPRLCTAVVILLDTSGSMAQTVRDRAGKTRQKQVIAREALGGIIDHTEEWAQKHPDVKLDVGILQFSSDVSILLPLAPFNAQKAKEALRDVRASSGTAIGRALEAGYKALYATGCTRKHIVCITDGENSSGPSPEAIARLYHEATEGAVPIHMVAFDTSSKKFRFLKNVNGDVVEAADGAQLEERLGEIYDQRIFAEAMPSENQDR